MENIKTYRIIAWNLPLGTPHEEFYAKGKTEDEAIKSLNLPPYYDVHVM